MPRPNTQASPPGNRLLAALPPREYARLRRHLEPVRLAMGDVLHHPGQPVPHVHFPVSSVLSLLAVLHEGGGVEVGLVGPEGMAGLPLLLGARTSATRCVVQIPGEALRMWAEAFQDKVGPGSPLHNLLLRYTHAFLAQVSQAAACNSKHPVEQRLCRWLLAMQDRAGGDGFPLTHEFLAAMLGVRRASVTEVAQVLRGAGLIRYTRGNVTVLDRPGLEAAACECHAVSQAELARVFA